MRLKTSSFLRLILTLGLALGLLSPSASLAAEKETATARSTSGAAGDPGFFVLRGETRINPEKSEMKLFTGDVVTPLPGRTVEIVHKSMACGTLTVDRPFTVNCTATAQSGSFMKNVFNDYIEDMKTYIYRTPQKEAHSETTRAVALRGPGDIFKNVSLPYWPMDQASVLAGEPMQFQWGPRTPDAVHRDQPWTLIVSPVLAPDDTVATRPFKPGQLNTLPPTLPPGVYLWHVEHSGINVSGFHSFRILDTDVSASVKADLAAFEKQIKDECILMGKSIYLQMQSRPDEGVDLFPDSLRIATTGNCFLNSAYNMIFIHNLNEYLADKAQPAPAP